MKTQKFMKIVVVLAMAVGYGVCSPFPARYCTCFLSGQYRAVEEFEEEVAQLAEHPKETSLPQNISTKPTPFRPSANPQRLNLGENLPRDLPPRK